MRARRRLAAAHLVQAIVSESKWQGDDDRLRATASGWRLDGGGLEQLLHVLGLVDLQSPLSVVSGVVGAFKQDTAKRNLIAIGAHREHVRELCGRLRDALLNWVWEAHRERAPQ